jgi:hypothetical protein
MIPKESGSKMMPYPLFGMEIFSEGYKEHMLLPPKGGKINKDAMLRNRIGRVNYV